jgi:hypothetical protein
MLHVPGEFDFVAPKGLDDVLKVSSEGELCHPDYGVSDMWFGLRWGYGGGHHCCLAKRDGMCQEVGIEGGAVAYDCIHLLNSFANL